MGLDPLRTSADIQEAYLRYLGTAFPLADADLAAQFRQALADPGRFIKGPYLEATPPFLSGVTLGALVNDGLLTKGFRRLDSTHLPLDRPLYLHQEQAVRKAVASRRNLIVATGTGSGKTECFLIPILHYLMREHEQGKLGPGTRALLLYPMNALANDQLKRLRRLLDPYPEITFGRYTGETKETPKEAEQHFSHNYPHEPRLPNELLSRDAMRAKPPHLLLTNYAMLEYLLLRPDDCPFFDGTYAGHWRFLVLDEVHTYNGAVGIELAMLLRRLKDRITGSESGKLQCMATSATLGGPDDFPALTHFAGQLFGEPFAWEEADEGRQDVVTATRVRLEEMGQPWGEPDADLYVELGRAVEDGRPCAELAEIAGRHGVPQAAVQEARQAHAAAPAGEKIHAFLHRLLRGDGWLHRLRLELRQRWRAPVLDRSPTLRAVARYLFGEGGPEKAAALVDLAVQARDGEDSLPLLPARYHLFIRALEGAYVCLAPAPELLLDRAERRQRAGFEYPVFELASCKRCGQAYLVGRVDDGKPRKLRPPPTPTSDGQADVEFYRLIDAGASEAAPEDEDEGVAAGEEQIQQAGTLQWLCAGCGAVGPEPAGLCGCPHPDPRRLQLVPSKDRQVNHCPACGARSPGVVLRFLTGQDAPVSVVATALYQDIPAAELDAAADTAANNEWSAAAPKEEVPPGRKLLTFSDSRQDAAFFACYLERTYHQVLRRRLIVLTLEQNSAAVTQHWRVEELVEPLRKIAAKHGLFSPALGPVAQANEVRKWLLQELVAYDRRNSLEGLGLLAFEPVRPENWVPPAPLKNAPWNLLETEVWNLYRVLLDNFRYHGALTFPDGVRYDDEVFAPRNRAYSFRQDGASPRNGIFAWVPAKNCRNRRLDFFDKLYRRCTGQAANRPELDKLLADLWAKTLTTQQPFGAQMEQFAVRDMGIVYRYRHEFFQLAGFGAAGWYRCSHCRQVTRLNLRGICTTYRCQGVLQPCDPEQEFADNHYRQLYRGLRPMPMEVAEHTAQLTSEAAATLQDCFVRGEVNVLSCSTTFELGVDVGELEAVLLRNVPPESSNYVQRAGRAGRRSSSTAFAVTFCQRRSHDLTYFHQPERMIAGLIRPPHFDLHNPKILRRHAYAVALAWFFRQRPQMFGYVESFFLPADPPTGTAALRELLAQQPAGVRDSLKRVVPADMQNADGIDPENWSWTEELLGPQGVLEQAEQLVRQDVGQLEGVYKELVEQRRPADFILRAITTIRKKNLIGYLANHNVLPKYGFPVDVVELELLHHGEAARRLELQRDLRIAISEYAPGGEVVAGGRLWVNRGLKRLATMDWPKYHYAVCDQCGRYCHTQFHGNEPPATCSSCGASLHGVGKKGQFLSPIFGFLTDTSEPRWPTEARPERTYSTRVFFVQEGQGPEMAGVFEANGIRVSGRSARSGRLAVLNWTGFKVCGKCGFAVPIWQKVKSHRAPWSRAKDCEGTLYHWDLGHEFNTDVFDLRFSGLGALEEKVWFSLLYALLEGASEALSIRRDDLDGCLYPYAGTAAGRPLILFDNVPGGAGHVRRIGQSLEAVLRAARERVDGRCGCGGGPEGPGETSCYGCLRGYRNQWTHDQLQRGPVRRLLDGLLEDTPPSGDKAKEDVIDAEFEIKK